MKLYLTPSDQKTIEELSQAVGKTTKRVVTRSRAVGRNPFEGRSVTERTEETPLLSEDEARRLDLDEVILVVDAQMPIRAQRIKYFEDPVLQALHAGQSGPYPYPDSVRLSYEQRLKEAEASVQRLAIELQVVRREKSAEATGGEGRADFTGKLSRAPLRKVAAQGARSVSLDLAGLKGGVAGQKALESAVLKTADILAEHGVGGGAG